MFAVLLFLFLVLADSDGIPERMPLPKLIQEMNRDFLQYRPPRNRFEREEAFAEWRAAAVQRYQGRLISAEFRVRKVVESRGKFYFEIDQGKDSAYSALKRTKLNASKRLYSVKFPAYGLDATGAAAVKPGTKFDIVGRLKIPERSTFSNWAACSVLGYLRLEIEEIRYQKEVLKNPDYEPDAK